MFREKVYGLLAKVEAVSGTDAAPDPAVDAIRTAGMASITYGYLEQGERDDVVSGYLGTADRAAAAGRYATLEVPMELKGAGAAYDGTPLTGAPECDPFLRAAGMSRTISGGAGLEQILYTTLDDGMETITCWAYTHHKLVKLVGCVAAWKLAMDANKRAIISFTVTGRVAADPTEVALPSLTFNATIPPLFNGGAATIGTWSSAAGSDPLVLRKMALDSGITIAERPSAGASDGHAGYAITDRKVKQQMTIETPLLTSLDPFALSKANGNTLPVTTAQLGTNQYNKVQIQTGRWALVAPKLGGDKGIGTMDLDGSLVMGAAPTTNRELNLLFN